MINENSFRDPDEHPWDQADVIACEAFELYEKGQMQEALEKLTEAIEMNPSYGAWYFNKGLTLDALERYEEAIECYLRAIELCGEDVEILNSLAVDYTRTCQYDLALEIFEKIEEMDPGYEPCYCNRIITYTELERYDKAEEMFYLAQQIEPDCPICFYNIGNALFSQGRYERAIWCWQRTAHLDGNHPQIYYRIAQACWAAGRREEAREYFLKEIRREPGNLEVILDFGIFLLQQGDIEAAKEKFNRLLELEPEYAPAWFYKGELVLNLGRPEEAIEYYQRALGADRKLKGPRFRLAQLCAEKEPEKAIQYLHQEISTDLDEPDVLLAMGWLSARLGQHETACRCFLRVLDQDRIEPLAFYGLALCLAVRREYDAAEQCLKQAVSLKPDLPAFHLAGAWLSLQQQQWEQALRRAELALEIEPKNRALQKSCRQIRRAVQAVKYRTKINNLLSKARRLVRFKHTQSLCAGKPPR
ncbi:MAG: tetratricopeptide repeat protein [Anaerohalosphaeraceae bacterium]